MFDAHNSVVRLHNTFRGTLLLALFGGLSSFLVSVIFCNPEIPSIFCYLFSGFVPEEHNIFFWNFDWPTVGLVPVSI